jgi:two-component system chemotaxis sensor kinase CheA
MTIDLTQFHDAFFEESFEALDSMEAALLKLDIGAPEPELINTIFRVAHSIKGGSATFGFSDIASFTHSLETLLDELRSGGMQVTLAISDLLLKSVDVMRAMLRSTQAKQPLDMQKVSDLQFDLELTIAQKNSAPPAKPAPAPAAAPAATAPGGAVASTSGVPAGAVPAGAASTTAPVATVGAAGAPGAAGAAGAAAPAATAPVAAVVATPYGAPVGASPAATGSAATASAAAGPGHATASPAAATATASTSRGWEISFRPYRELFARGNDPLRMLRELAELGDLTVHVDTSALPTFSDLDSQSCYLAWNLELAGDVLEADIKQVFEWAEGDCDLELRQVGAPEANAAALAPAPAAGDATQATLVDGPAPNATAESQPAIHADRSASAGAADAAVADAILSATDHKPDAPAHNTTAASAPAATPAASAPAAPTHQPTLSPVKENKPDTPVAAIGDSGSIRVSVEKIDELMNTVGELVITQAMLSQLGTAMEGPNAEKLRAGLAQLERNTRELQESVMRVRMLPISFVFSRFPRMVRDIAQRLGKQIDLKLTGEQTELDKTVLEKIGDPLVHLVRNSIDHGIEMPDARIAAGKPAAGTVHLDACHRGGNIAVEVSDDGGGLDKDRILAKARQRGLVGPNDALTDDQIHDLIFLPGFSTAEKTTDLSGRGVGMDVVRRNVKELGGKIELRSEQGKGSRFIITLPLTLAIVDGQSVAVGSETYIIPLISIVESMRLKETAISRLSGHNEVFSFRGDYLPIIRLHELFGVEPRARALHEGLVVIAEGDGRRVGLFVDDLLGQQQVVIKSLEANYGHVEGVSGATILGDGSVALILDVTGIIHAASMRAAA